MAISTTNYMTTEGAAWVVGAGGTLTVAGTLSIGGDTFTPNASGMVLTGLLTSDPGVTGCVWQSGVHLMISAG